MRMQIGCINRPWNPYELTDALAGIAAAGFRTLGLMLQKNRYVVTADMTDEECERLRGQLEQAGLELQMVLSPLDLKAPVEQAAAQFDKAMARAARLGARYMLTGGTEDPALYEPFFALTRAICDLAADRGMQIVLKPHGGCSASADELLTAVDRVDRPNFGICYDPGNIYYYTGKRAEDDLPRVVQHVRCLCIKDERGGLRGEVMITPGTGVVDFASIFRTLREAGFAGPGWIECLGGRTLAEINAEAIRARTFVERVLASVG